MSGPGAPSGGEATLTKTTWVTASVLVVVLGAQFALRRYVPAVDWAAVVLISVVGTQITDNLTDGHGVPLRTTSDLFPATILAVVVHPSVTRRDVIERHGAAGDQRPPELVGEPVSERG